jgi:hypothetical protein
VMRPALYWVVKRSDGEYSEARAFITSCRPFGDSLRVVRVVSKRAVDNWGMG